LAGFRPRHPGPGPGVRQRARPQDFRIRPRRTFDWFPLIVLSLVGAAVAWWWTGATVGGGGAELRLKSTDKAVAQKTMMNWAMLDENKPLPVGTTLQTRGARKTVFAAGNAASLRVGPDSEMTLKNKIVSGNKTTIVMAAQVGRFWMVGGGDVEWILESPLCIVRQQGRVTEVTVAKDGHTSVRSWQGATQLEPQGRPEHAVIIDENQEAAFGPDRTLENPHPLTLTRNDPFLNWNLLETMQRTITEKPASQ